MNSFAAVPRLLTDTPLGGRTKKAILLEPKMGRRPQGSAN